jgi:hypothetical protein
MIFGAGLTVYMMGIIMDITIMMIGGIIVMTTALTAFHFDRHA